MDPIIWRDSKLRLLDQTRLPGETVYVECADYRAVVEAIRRMRVRGAPAIGIAAAFAMVLAARETCGNGYDPKLDQCAEIICQARPTAVNLGWAVKRMLTKAAACRAAAPGSLCAVLEQEALTMLQEDIAANKQIGRYGCELVKEGAAILTHCNTGFLATAGYGTALGVIRAAWSAGKNITVYADETRPFLQGARLTAWELMQDKIPVTLITDSMAGYFMQQGKIDLVIVGADRIAANGDTANKIGTYSVAVLAREHGIPFYVTAPVSTVDLKVPDGKFIPIEERSAAEVTHIGGVPIAPAGVKVANPAFDVTPQQYITAIVTDRGIVVPPYSTGLAAVCRK